MVTVAPNFTPRGGYQVVAQQSPALRNSAMVRDNPRGSFEINYNPMHLSPQSGAAQHRYAHAHAHVEQVIANTEQSARARLFAVNSDAAKEFLLKMAWHAWKNVWKEEKRYISLEVSLRVLEDDLNRARKNTTELLAAKRELDARHHISGNIKVHPAGLEGPSSKDGTRDSADPEKPNLVNLPDPKKTHPKEARTEKLERDRRAILTRKEYKSYFAKVKNTWACYYMGSVILFACNLAAMIYNIMDYLCAGEPLDWWLVFCICIPFDVLTLICAAYWFSGAADIANDHLYLASEFRKRANENEDQLDNYHKHLKSAYARQARGWWIVVAGNIVLKIGMGVQIVWVLFALVGCSMVLRFPEHYWCGSFKASCWTALFSFRLIWSVVTLRLPNYLDPRKSLPLPLDITAM